MTNEDIARNIARAASAYAGVTLEQWQYIEELAGGLEGKILSDIQDGIFEHYSRELIQGLIAIAGGRPGQAPKEVNCDIYAGLLRGIQIASLKEIAKFAHSAIERERKKTETRANGNTQLPANPYV